MEFEKNTPATDDEIALADTSRLTLQPKSVNIAPEPLNTNRSHQNEQNFTFESETTDPSITPDSPEQPGNQSHNTAILVAVGCAVVFGAAVAAIFVLR